MDKLKKIDTRIGVFVLDGKSSKDFNIICNGSAVYSMPARNVESVDVAGKNGALIFDNGSFQNITISYSCTVLQDFEKSIALLKSYYGSRNGYVRLEDSYTPDFFRMAYCNMEMQVEGIKPNHGGPYQGGNFTINFNCKPQLFYKSGEKSQDYASGDKLYNPSYMTANPLITVYETGTYHIGSSSFTINSLNGCADCTIDSELQDCYHDLTSLNQYVTIDEFPELPQGETGLQFDAEKITITPRWWTL